jgi:hypothetical protein
LPGMTGWAADGHDERKEARKMDCFAKARNDGGCGRDGENTRGPDS